MNTKESRSLSWADLWPRLKVSSIGAHGRHATSEPWPPPVYGTHLPEVIIAVVVHTVITLAGTSTAIDKERHETSICHPSSASMNACRGSSASDLADFRAGRSVVD